jgi:hypothetical protein
LQHAAFQSVNFTKVSIDTGYSNKQKAVHSMVEGTPLSNSLKQDGIDIESFEQGADGIYDHFLQPDGSLSFSMHAIFGVCHK